MPGIQTSRGAVIIRSSTNRPTPNPVAASHRRPAGERSTGTGPAPTGVRRGVLALAPGGGPCVARPDSAAGPQATERPRVTTQGCVGRRPGPAAAASPTPRRRPPPRKNVGGCRQRAADPRDEDAHVVSGRWCGEREPDSRDSSVADKRTRSCGAPAAAVGRVAPVGGRLAASGDRRVISGVACRSRYTCSPGSYRDDQRGDPVRGEGPVTGPRTGTAPATVYPVGHGAHRSSAAAAATGDDEAVGALGDDDGGGSGEVLVADGKGGDR